MASHLSFTLASLFTLLASSLYLSPPGASSNPLTDGVVASLVDAFAVSGGAEAAADEADDEAEGEGDAEVDGAIDAYLDHQRRVLASAHRALDALEAGGAKRRRTTVDG